MPSAGPRLLFPLCVLRPQMEQLHSTEQRGGLDSFWGTKHTQDAQSPGWSGACLTVSAGAGTGRPTQASSWVTVPVTSAVPRSAQCRGKRS